MAVDTLKLYERLRKTDLSEAASKEIAEAIKESGEDLSANSVTKADLELSLEKLKGDLIRWVAAMLIAQAGLFAALIKLL